MTTDSASFIRPIQAQATNPLIIIVGRNGQHKRELVRRAVAAFSDQLKLVPTVTNKCPHGDDADGEFLHRPDFAIIKMEFIEWARRPDGTFYGRTLDMLVEALQDHIAIAIMSEEGALQVLAERVFPCYVVRIVTVEDDLPAEPTISLAGLRASLEITCRQDEEGFANALDALQGVFQKLTTGFKTTRPPPPPPPPSSTL